MKTEVCFHFSTLSFMPFLLLKLCSQGEGTEKTEPNLSEAHGGRSSSRRQKFVHGKFRLGIMRNFFTMNIAKHWNRLSREPVSSPALEILKTWQVKS